MDQRLLRATWLGVLGAVFVLPVLVYLAISPAGTLWSQLSIVTGLLALSAMVCAAVLPSRLRSLTRALGIETVIDAHRFLGTSAAVLVLLHLACVVAADPVKVSLLDVTTAGRAPRAAVGATVAVVALVVVAALRARGNRSYEQWRLVHIVLAGVALLLSALHVWWLENLVQDPVMGFLLTLVAVLLVAVLVHRWVWRALLDPSTEFVVREVRRESPTVSTLVLVPQMARHAGEAWSFAPGQFAWIKLRRSVTAEEHPFTIASSAGADRRIEFTIRQAGDFTRALARLRPGTPVWVDGPHGSFTPEARASSGVVMIAGGVGVTPMMSILRTAAHHGDPRPHRLIAIASRHQDLLFRDELADLRRHLDLEVTEVLRRPHPGWSGHTGEIGVELLAAVLAGAQHAEDLDYFICGPPSLVADALEALAVLEVPAENVHTEQFDFA
ncbi:MAG TPA: ferric reductase-like transmembrane domain-containing protein [Pseudonocardia sp.]|nr:ferric reductase-like transmembrane domain-containing protein [Pseudonocardia sp.]